MEHEHPAPALNSSKILVIDDEKILEQGLGNDIHVADVPGVVRSLPVLRRTGVAPSKLSHVLDSIRTRFELARSLGATSVKATSTPARPNLASDLARLSRELESTEVPEVEFDQEAKTLVDACQGYTASKSNWMKESASVVQRPKEPLENLYSQCLRVVRSHGAAVLLLLCLATGAFAQAPMGAGASKSFHFRTPHIRMHHHHNAKRSPFRGHWHRQR